MGGLLSRGQSRRAYRQRVSQPLRLREAVQPDDDDDVTPRPGYLEAAKFMKRVRKAQKKQGKDSKKKADTRVVSPLRTEKHPAPKPVPPPGAPNKPLPATAVTSPLSKQSAQPQALQQPPPPPPVPVPAPSVAVVPAAPTVPVSDGSGLLLSAAEVKSLVESCTCSVCEELLAAPASLTCGHNYCRKCVIKWYRAQLKTRASVTQPPVCPMCRAPLMPDEDDDEEDVFKINRALENLVKVLKAHPKDVAEATAPDSSSGPTVS